MSQGIKEDITSHYGRIPDVITSFELEQRLRQRITAAIEERAVASIQATTGLTLEPGVALFDRSRQLWAVGPRGQSWFAEAAF